MGIILEKNGHGLPQVAQLECTYVVPPDEDRSLFRIVESHYELEDGALSSAIHAHDDLWSVRTPDYESQLGQNVRIIDPEAE